MPSICIMLCCFPKPATRQASIPADLHPQTSLPYPPPSHKPPLSFLLEMNVIPETADLPSGLPPIQVALAVKLRSPVRAYTGPRVVLAQGSSFFPSSPAGSFEIGPRAQANFARDPRRMLARGESYTGAFSSLWPGAHAEEEGHGGGSFNSQSRGHFNSSRTSG